MVVILLLNVMEVVSVGGGALLCMVLQRVYITYSIGRRMNGREYENKPEMNSVIAKEGHVFSTTLDIEIKFVIKRIQPQMKVSNCRVPESTGNSRCRGMKRIH